MLLQMVLFALSSVSETDWQFMSDMPCQNLVQLHFNKWFNSHDRSALEVHQTSAEFYGQNRFSNEESSRANRMNCSSAAFGFLGASCMGVVVGRGFW